MRFSNSGLRLIVLTVEFNVAGSVSIPSPTAIVPALPSIVPVDADEDDEGTSWSEAENAFIAILIIPGSFDIASNCSIDVSICSSVMDDMCGFVRRNVSRGIERSIVACIRNCSGDMDDICLAAASICSLDIDGGTLPPIVDDGEGTSVLDPVPAAAIPPVIIAFVRSNAILMSLSLMFLIWSAAIFSWSGSFATASIWAMATLICSSFVASIRARGVGGDEWGKRERGEKRVSEM
jgi:hypothetical protein